MAGESRTELLNWLNVTLDLNYTKVETCGTGAAFCQLMDSIVGGIPMSKVRFDDARTEYDYRSNWKILQAAFTRNGITKHIEVEKLIKCRLQDNLELLQWFRKYWLENKGYNDNYDARTKRPNNTTATTSSPTAVASAGRRVSSASNGRTSLMTPTTPVSNLTQNHTASSSKLTAKYTRELSESKQQIASLNEELQEYRISSESLETERNFYFNKLRQIEILVQHITEMQESENLDEIAALTVPQFATQIQTILYSTEEGFQSTNEVEHELGANGAAAESFSDDEGF
ncbi:hypothetical protein PICST_80317 [Scheffersomyces stipitis CBS 6054]|uniref:Bim1p and Kar9p together make up the cortical microtubule-capture site. delays the exit from mitosis when the spindle is oriented abnormally n=1 Tax=Scheffersomyces stipitis (strain ATCC 58785 / CBS 6054 / NBRC 10063 / NRRL Y-11545) TaxID=322104 RepID=A3GFL9_PICST|nr:Bim1p and Kar9p together make up the cortical microtubule-capture site. delays the exit from mitosis when the spindle is oriented abnormally [Scheffersomyces stipitis CBS 6054]EAZ63777.2 hypothetical protein PICST_80317 [Scheffersomyces stipitis CBS 6054]